MIQIDRFSAAMWANQSDHIFRDARKADIIILGVNSFDARFKAAAGFLRTAPASLVSRYGAFP
jgi:hypothetical protein